MISSQDGTEDRRPRADFFAGRAAGSLLASSPLPAGTVALWRSAPSPAAAPPSPFAATFPASAAADEERAAAGVASSAAVAFSSRLAVPAPGVVPGAIAAPGVVVAAASAVALLAAVPFEAISVAVSSGMSRGSPVPLALLAESAELRLAVAAGTDDAAGDGGA